MAWQAEQGLGLYQFLYTYLYLYRVLRVGARGGVARGLRRCACQVFYGAVWGSRS